MNCGSSAGDLVGVDVQVGQVRGLRAAVPTDVEQAADRIVAVVRLVVRGADVERRDRDRQELPRLHLLEAADVESGTGRRSTSSGAAGEQHASDAISVAGSRQPPCRYRCRLFVVLVPTLRVGTRSADARTAQRGHRKSCRSHAERGNDAIRPCDSLPSLSNPFLVPGSSRPTSEPWCRSCPKSASPSERSKTSVVIEPVWPTNWDRSCREATSQR